MSRTRSTTFANFAGEIRFAADPECDADRCMTFMTASLEMGA
jgi:hypothetical protein